MRVVDKRVSISGLNEFIQIGDRCDEANLELGEKSGTRSTRCNSKFASIVAGWVSLHFSDTLSGRSVSLVRDIIICN